MKTIIDFKNLLIQNKPFVIKFIILIITSHFLFYLLFFGPEQVEVNSTRVGYSQVQIKAFLHTPFVKNKQVVIYDPKVQKTETDIFLVEQNNSQESFLDESKERFSIVTIDVLNDRLSFFYSPHQIFEIYPKEFSFKLNNAQGVSDVSF